MATLYSEIDVPNAREFWKDKRVLVTGHSGFKGGWLACMLSILGADVYGYSSERFPGPNAFQVWEQNFQTLFNVLDGEICDFTRFTDFVESCAPDIVIHLAAQPLVSESYRDPLGTVRTNVLGTTSVLEACRKVESVRTVLIVTTDKVYQNLGPRAYTESDQLGGADVYSASKASCELLVNSYRDSFFQTESNSHQKRIATARAGNVIGGGDWSEKRLVPDLVRAFERGHVCSIRSPNAPRPWQHVLEPLDGYLCLARKLFEGQVSGGAWNFGPNKDDVRSVKEVAEHVSARLPGLRVDYEKRDAPVFKEMQDLNLDSGKAAEQLGWVSKLSFESCLDFTCDWYRSAPQTNAAELTLGQITTYMELTRPVARQTKVLSS